MDRSSGFGSTPNDSCRPVRTRFRCASPTRLSLPLNVSRCPIMQKVRSHPCGLLLFVCMRFQDLFHSPPGVLFAFPSQYWFAIGRLRVFSLGGWSPHLRAGFHVSRSTSRKLSTLNPISRTGLSPSVAGLSRPFQYRIQYHLQALPISLAATFRISVDFFSCSYLDVSVRCVRLLKLCIHFKIPLRVSSLIRTSVDQCSLASSPRLFAGCDVLHRL